MAADVSGGVIECLHLSGKTVARCPSILLASAVPTHWVKGQLEESNEAESVLAKDLRRARWKGTSKRFLFS